MTGRIVSVRGYADSCLLVHGHLVLLVADLVLEDDPVEGVGLGGSRAAQHQADAIRDRILRPPRLRRNLRSGERVERLSRAWRKGCVGPRDRLLIASSRVGLDDPQ